MKLAIFLTGLIGHRTGVLPYINEQFNYLRSNGLEVDVYCVFWSPTSRFPYKLEGVTPYPNIPTESYDSIQQAIDILKPVDYSVISYDELTHSFIDYCEMSQQSDLVDLHKSQTFIDKIITSDYFNESSNEQTVKKFESWYNYHNTFCKFAHHASQIYSANCALNLLKETDVVLKWRYDLLFNWHKFTNKLKLILELSEQNKNLLFINRAWREQNSIKILRYDNPLPNKIIADDQWYVSSREGMENVKNSFYNKFVLAYANVTTNNVMQHQLFYEALYNVNGITLETVGSIDELLIRNDNTIPNNFLHNTALYTKELIEENKLKFEKSQYLVDLYKKDYHGAILQKMKTIGEFNFNSK